MNSHGLKPPILLSSRVAPPAGSTRGGRKLDAQHGIGMRLPAVVERSDVVQLSSPRKRVVPSRGMDVPANRHRGPHAFNLAEQCSRAVGDALFVSIQQPERRDVGQENVESLGDMLVKTL